MRRVAVVLCLVLAPTFLFAATRTWTGTNSALWSDPGNWGGFAVGALDDLVFPAGASNLSNTNDTGVSYESITVTGSGYTLGGNGIGLAAGGLTVSQPVTINLVNITLNQPQTWSISAGTTMNGELNLFGQNLTINLTGGFLELFGLITDGQGGGSLTFTGVEEAFLTSPASTYTGPITNNGAEVSFIGTTLTGPFVQSSGESGPSSNGTIGTVTINGGTFTPGLQGNGTGNSASIALTAAATYGQTLVSTNPNQFGNLHVTGTVNLGGATLDLFESATFPGGTSFLIIDNDGVDPVVGTFAGLPNGATVTGTFQPFVISYTGGDGNDVVLTALGAGSATTTTTLTSAPNPSVVGQNVTFTATVTSGTPGTPTGNVEFFEGATSLGIVALSGGVANLSTTSLAAGSHSVFAMYYGDATFASSTSNTVTQLVIAAAANPIPALDGRSMALLAALLGAAAILILRR